MIAPYETMFMRALGLTIGVELPLVALLLGVWPWPRSVSWKRILVAGTLPTLTTLPYLWFLAPVVLTSRMSLFCLAEPAIALVEAAIVRSLVRTTWARALVVSFVANGASLAVGLVLGRGGF